MTGPLWVWLGAHLSAGSAAEPAPRSAEPAAPADGWTDDFDPSLDTDAMRALGERRAELTEQLRADGATARLRAAQRKLDADYAAERARLEAEAAERSRPRPAPDLPDPFRKPVPAAMWTPRTPAPAKAAAPEPATVRLTPLGWLCLALFRGVLPFVLVLAIVFAMCAMVTGVGHASRAAIRAAYGAGVGAGTGVLVGALPDFLKGVKDGQADSHR